MALKGGLQASKWIGRAPYQKWYDWTTELVRGQSLRWGTDPLERMGMRGPDGDRTPDKIDEENWRLQGLGPKEAHESDDAFLRHVKMEEHR